MKRILLTGGCGFVGHHVLEHLLKNTESDIIIIDKLSYASCGFDRLRDILVWDDKRVKIFSADLNKPIIGGLLYEIGQVDYILHLAAESHVDNSITDPVPFILNNVTGTLNLLEFARLQKNLKLFINFSTDEVYGPAPENFNYPEFYYHNPSNPYAASKSAQEAFGIAYSNTYKVPLINTHTMNVFGERQHPEKFVPMVIRKVLNGEEVTIHANKDKTKAGSRFYIHGRNVASALLFLMNKGYDGYDEWNIVGEIEVDNLQLAQYIAEEIGKPLVYVMTDFHSSRPGHDLRYALDGKKLAEVGFSYQYNFRESLSKMVQWTLNRKEWLEEK